VDMVRQIGERREISVAGQIMLDGINTYGQNAYGLKGVMGLPLILSNQGVVRVQTPTLWPEEERALSDASRAISQKIAAWRAN
jgi:malate/lactate dehydrogenase